MAVIKQTVSQSYVEKANASEVKVTPPQTPPPPAQRPWTINPPPLAFLHLIPYYFRPRASASLKSPPLCASRRINLELNPLQARARTESRSFSHFKDSTKGPPSRSSSEHVTGDKRGERALVGKQRWGSRPPSPSPLPPPTPARAPQTHRRVSTESRCDFLSELFSALHRPRGKKKQPPSIPFVKRRRPESDAPESRRGSRQP